MASKRELEALIVLAGKIDPSLQKAIRGSQKHIGGLSQATGFFGKAADKAFSIASKAAAIGAVGIGVGLVAVAKQGLELASSLTEVQNVVDVTFGNNSKQIDAWSKTALNSFGLSELSAKQYSSTLGAMMKSSGISSKHLVSMSENLTALSGDFASFYNLPTADAFEKIRAGISGETEPLKQLGINMNVANLQAYALAHGIKTSYDKMSQADQSILRYNYLLEVSKDAQGDFMRTQDGYANQQRLFGESFKQLSATIMKAALPAMTSLLKKGNQLISAFANNPEKVAKLQQTIGGIADKVVSAMPTAIKVVSNFADGMVVVFNEGSKVAAMIRDNWSFIGPTILGIVGAMAAWKLAMTISDTIKAFKIVLDGLTWALNLLSIAKGKDALATIYLGSLYVTDSIIRGANTIATWAMVAAGGAWNIIATIGAGITWAFGAAVAFLLSPIGLVLLAVGALIGIFVLLYKNWDTVSAFLSNTWDHIKLAFASGINWVVNKINWLIEKMNKIPGVDIPLIPTIDTSNYDAAQKAAGAAPAGMAKFASGGFANRASIFGEAGPEAAIPIERTPRSLSLLNQTARAIGADVGGASGGGSPTFVFAPVYGGSGAGPDLKSAFEDFKSKCDEWWESKRRESFG